MKSTKWLKVTAIIILAMGAAIFVVENLFRSYFDLSKHHDDSPMWVEITSNACYAIGIICYLVAYFRERNPPPKK